MTGRAGPSREQALVLRTIRHGETSRIATLFAPGIGKLAVLAKGARSGKSGAVGGALDAPSLIEAIIHIKPSRSVQLLGQTSVINSFSNLKADVGKTAYSAVFCELILRGFTDDESNPNAFNSLASSLSWLNDSNVSGRYILISFMLDLAGSLGFGIDPFTCPNCGASPGKTGVLNKFIPEAGAICCSDCSCPDREPLNISGESVAVLRLLRRGGTDLSRVRISRPAQDELSSLLLKHLQFHHQSFNHLPSLVMLRQLTSD